MRRVLLLLFCCSDNADVDAAGVVWTLFCCDGSAHPNAIKINNAATQRNLKLSMKILLLAGRFRNDKTCSKPIS
jgi:hypothetical protein